MPATLLAASAAAAAAAVVSNAKPRTSCARTAISNRKRHPTNAVSAGREERAAGACLSAGVLRVSPTRRTATAAVARPTTAAAASSTSAPPAVQEGTAEAPSKVPVADQFEWAKAWYPMSPMQFLEPDEPNPMKVLGRSVVAWKAEGGVWKVVEDSCPHRMAPLSLGFVGPERQLVCRYHGWEFDGDGKASCIPMSTDAKAEATARESPRSCATSFPAKEEGGVLWVWPTAGADAWLQASATPVATAAAEFGDLPGEWGMVELPVGYAPALENQFDPAHAEWLHAQYDDSDGQRSAANAEYQPMTRFGVVPGSMGAAGFTVEHGGYNRGNADISAERLFTAPCSSRSEYMDKDGKRYLSAAILYTPTEPGRCLMFTKFQAHQRTAVQGAGKRRVTTGDRVRSLLTAPADAAFEWYMQYMVEDPELVQVGLSHGVYGTAAYTLGDQDIQAMHGVEVAMETSEKGWRGSYYLPTPSDAGVAGFRGWMDRHAGGGVQWAKGVTDDASKVKPLEQRLERFDRHTRHCRHCKETLAELGVLEERCVTFSNAMLLAGLVLGLGGAVLGQEAPAVVSLCLAGLAVNAAEAARDMQNEFLTSKPRRGVPIPKLW